MQNEELAEKWRKAIGRTDKKLNQYHKVCEFHFEKKLIIRHDRVLMPEDIVYECERFRPSLVKGAFPTIFPEAPPEGYKVIKTRKRSTRVNVLLTVMDTVCEVETGLENVNYPNPYLKF